MIHYHSGSQGGRDTRRSAQACQAMCIQTAISDYHAQMISDCTFHSRLVPSFEGGAKYGGIASRSFILRHRAYLCFLRLQDQSLLVGDMRQCAISSPERQVARKKQVPALQRNFGPSRRHMTLTYFLQQECCLHTSSGPIGFR